MGILDEEQRQHQAMVHQHQTAVPSHWGIQTPGGGYNSPQALRIRKQGEMADGELPPTFTFTHADSQGSSFAGPTAEDDRTRQIAEDRFNGMFRGGLLDGSSTAETARMAELGYADPDLTPIHR